MKYEYWFANIQGITCRNKQQIRASFSSAKELYYIEETALKKMEIEEKDCQRIIESVKTWKLEEEYEKLQRQQTKFYTMEDKNYPEKLRSISSPPYVVYVKGNLPNEEVLSVAIVGARQCSHYGEKMARRYAKVLSEAGIQIISGMARGIDGVSQRTALSEGGKTFGVLGCGVDVCYPREHYALYNEIRKKRKNIHT